LTNPIPRIKVQAKQLPCGKQVSEIEAIHIPERFSVYAQYDDQQHPNDVRHANAPHVQACPGTSYASFRCARKARRRFVLKNGFPAEAGRSGKGRMTVTEVSPWTLPFFLLSEIGAEPKGGT